MDQFFDLDQAVGEQLPLPFDQSVACSASFSKTSEALAVNSSVLQAGSSLDTEGPWQQYILVRMGGYGYERDKERQVKIVEKELKLQFGSQVQLVVGLKVTLEEEKTNDG